MHRLTPADLAAWLRVLDEAGHAALLDSIVAETLTPELTAQVEVFGQDRDRDRVETLRAIAKVLEKRLGDVAHASESCGVCRDGEARRFLWMLREIADGRSFH